MDRKKQELPPSLAASNPSGPTPGIGIGASAPSAPRKKLSILQRLGLIIAGLPLLIIGLLGAASAVLLPARYSHSANATLLFNILTLLVGLGMAAVGARICLRGIRGGQRPTR